MAEAARRESTRCADCATDVGPGLLACPACGRLVHGDRLRALVERAEAETAAGDLAAALTTWRDALPLLPESSRQHAVVLERVQPLGRRVELETPLAGKTGTASVPMWARAVPALGAIVLVGLKLKFLPLLLLLGKAKLLLLGLGKATTLLSMLASFGVYWGEWGWRFAAGLIGSMYVHEMGHVDMLRRYGMRATAPMFLPGFGAMVRSAHAPVDPREDARVGLAGPSGGSGSHSWRRLQRRRRAPRASPSRGAARGSTSSTCSRCGSSTVAGGFAPWRGPAARSSPA